MIISKNQVDSILKTYNKQLGVNKINKPGAAKQIGKNDDLVISGESKIKQKVLQAIKNSDDMRLDKVNELKERVSAGTYNVSDDEVAEKMIERAIIDQLI